MERFSIKGECQTATCRASRERYPQEGIVHMSGVSAEAGGAEVFLSALSARRRRCPVCRLAISKDDFVVTRREVIEIQRTAEVKGAMYPRPESKNPQVRCPVCDEWREVTEHQWRQIETEGHVEEQLTCDACKKQRIEVRCPLCGKRRSLSVEYLKRRGEKPQNGMLFCGPCSTKMAVAARRGPAKPIRMNGCVLVKTDRGRCAPYDACEHYDDCLMAVALRDWPGWECIDGRGRRVDRVAHPSAGRVVRRSGRVAQAR